MEVCSSAMGPERVLPSSEDELGEDERPTDGTLPPGAMWGGGNGEEEEAVGEMEPDGEEEEDEEDGSGGGYYYQPLNQEPDGVNGGEQPEDEEEKRGEETGEAASHSEQLQQVQQRIEVRSAPRQVSHVSPGTQLTCTSFHRCWGCTSPKLRLLTATRKRTPKEQLLRGAMPPSPWTQVRHTPVTPVR